MQNIRIRAYDGSLGGDSTVMNGFQKGDNMKEIKGRLLLITFALLLSASAAFAQGTAFTYQGKLTDGGTPANGFYDLQFALWDKLPDSLSNGTQIGSTQTVSGVSVSAGIFTVTIDFGANAFPGASRFLEISARPSGGGSFTTLSPRQQISSTPYAVRTLNAGAADALSSACAACIQDSNISSVSGSKVNGTIPVASVPAGSGNYIQNTTSVQTSSNFNISGNGTAGGTLSGNIVNATTQYNLGGSSFASAPGSHNTSVGLNAGTSSGFNNAFFGFQAGSTGGGNGNAFFGAFAGQKNGNASANSFFGDFAGVSETESEGNSFFGYLAGEHTTTGAGFNSSFGAFAGSLNTTGALNSFFGNRAGLSITTETNNTFLGSSSDGASGINNATAIGANAKVAQSNSLVLGSIAGQNSATANTNVGIGTTTPAAALHVVGPAGAGNVDAPLVLQVNGGKGGFLGKKGSGVLIQAGDGGDDVSVGGVGGSITLVPGAGGSAPISGGRGAVDVMGIAMVRGSGTFANNLGSADLQVGYGLGSPGTVNSVARLAIQPYGHTGGPWKFIARDDSTKAYLDWVFGHAATGITQDSSGKVGIGIGTPEQTLHVNGASEILSTGGGAGFKFRDRNSSSSADDWVWYSSGNIARFFRPSIGDMLTFTTGGVMTLNNLGAAGSTSLCRNASNQISTCSSSLRYKMNIASFSSGLDLIKRLRPITFDWKDGGMHDLGLGAEDVAKIDPLLVTYNAKGEVEGVKYDRVGVVLINAVKEQQAQIEAQQKQIEEQRKQVESLTKIVCEINSKADICRP